jgi:putative selenium metabolism protein SsnA
MKERKVKTFINARIYDYDKYIENGFISFDEKIISIGDMQDFKETQVDVIDLKNQMVIPSFISGHTHLYSSFARGMANEFNPQNFLEILEQLWWKLDNFLDKKMIHFSALVGAIDQLKHGTTTLIDHHASKVISGSLEQIKSALNDKLNLRSVLAFETSDRFLIPEAISENSDFIKNNQSEFISGLFGAHASLSLSDQSLKMISRNLNGAGFHIHVAESLMDEEDSLKKYNLRVVERLEKFNLLNEKSLLVHCTHINDKEMDIIKKYGCRVAVNVTSNLNNAVGITNIKKMLNKGIKVISGNDGLIQSQPMEYLNIYYLSHLKTLSPTNFSLDDILTIIKNTYEYTNLMLKTNLGKFKVGAEADFLVTDYQNFTPITKDNIFSHLFFGVYPGFRAKDVFVSGKQVIENYQLINDYDSLYKEARSQAQKLWDIVEKEGGKIEFNY